MLHQNAKCTNIHIRPHLRGVWLTWPITASLTHWLMRFRFPLGITRFERFSLSYAQLDCSGYSTIYRQLSFLFTTFDCWVLSSFLLFGVYSVLFDYLVNPNETRIEKLLHERWRDILFCWLIQLKYHSPYELLSYYGLYPNSRVV